MYNYNILEKYDYYSIIVYSEVNITLAVKIHSLYPHLTIYVLQLKTTGFANLHIYNVYVNIILGRNLIL
jgi:hypothetical protein